MAESKFLCLRCGSPVIAWRDGWKHANSGTSDTRSCGKPPRVAARDAYERDMQGVVDLAIEHTRQKP